MTVTAIACDEVALTYGRGATAVVAVHGVTCSIPTGARIVIMGPSGSGKSTLLHLLAGLETPTRGRVQWPGFGTTPASRPGLVGLVFQGPSLIPALDVVENVALPGILNGDPEADARELAIRSLTELDIESLANKLPEELSGGQAQRVAIARVLAARPSVILADEPTGQLDGATGAHVVDVLLQAANALGAAVVISTHDPSVAQRLDETWTMRSGALTTPAVPRPLVPVEHGATS
jgi:putative ABC transport system ATP-binding protein